jgi:hypothetical protein
MFVDRAKGKGSTRELNSRGYMNVLLIPLIAASVLLIAAAVFGVWAFQSREDYRLNTEDKISAAVNSAVKQEDIKKDQEHAEADKQPLKTYKSPEQFGSVQIAYPKTWSAYVIANGDSNTPLDAYFQPDIVPNVDDRSVAFAVRINLLADSYQDVVSGLQNKVESHDLTAQPYHFPKVPSIIGTRFDGKFDQEKDTSGIMVVVPLRDKTLEVWTESPVYAKDFTTFILPNLTFVP